MTYHSYYWGDGAPSPPPGTGPHVGHPFNQASVLALLDYVGADTSQPDVQAAARELITIVRAINTNQGLTGSSTTQFYSSYNKQNYDASTKHLALAAWIFWIVIWVLGLLLYHLIDRKTHSP